MKEHLWLKTLLTPFSRAYGFITSVRNRLYDKQVFSTHQVPQMVISVGNLTVGGTGKTPVIEYLAKLLSPIAPVAILSRGYGRKTTGFLLADQSSTAGTIGDEPMQFYRKFSASGIVVAVSENRAKGANAIGDLYPERKILLLDDAYQHRAIRRDLNILLNDFNRPFYTDLPFPAGRLREGKQGAQRADAVIVTKCPDHISEQERGSIERQIAVYTKPGTPVFFARTDYGMPLSFDNRPVSLKKVKMVAGIADPRPFIAYLSSRFDVVEKVIFPDHYNYTAQDLEGLIKYLKNDTFVVTTEKDMVKLKPLVEKSGETARFAYIPVAVNFGTETDDFSQWINNKMNNLI